MALARKCDVCGKLYETYNRSFQEMQDINGIAFASLNNNGGFGDYYSYDLCPECLWSILDHINVLKGLPRGLGL